jgi:hypothetical protein
MIGGGRCARSGAFHREHLEAAAPLDAIRFEVGMVNRKDRRDVLAFCQVFVATVITARTETVPLYMRRK